MTTRMPVGAAEATRGYDRTFTWGYGAAPTRAPLRPLVPVIWDGLLVNAGDQADGLCSVVTGVTGWLDSPPLNGNDVQRVISDGSAWGPKVLQARTIVISGAASGPREPLAELRHQLAKRAVNREPAQLAIGDMTLDRILTADVRAGTEQYRHQPLGWTGFRWQVTLTAPDPALYDSRWQTATLANITEGETGRDYPREYGWRYRDPYLANTVVLRNEGSVPAPVYALYQDELSPSTLFDAYSGIIRLAALADGMKILVSTATLTAETQNGQSRANYILPGSRPLLIPAETNSRVFLRAAGRGTVTLAWRSAWV
jgi:hypothetical protein